ncbi:MAG: hypothetical protein ACLP8B_22565, partial [Xanthobacteraceae bacterium]
MMVAVGTEQNLNRHPKKASRLPRVCATLQVRKGIVRPVHRKRVIIVAPVELNVLLASVVTLTLVSLWRLFRGFGWLTWSR